jgi:hypothetical protein
MNYDGIGCCYNATFSRSILRLTTYNIGCIFTIKPSLEGNKIVVLVPFKLFFKISILIYSVSPRRF